MLMIIVRNFVLFEPITHPPIHSISYNKEQQNDIAKQSYVSFPQPSCGLTSQDASLMISLRSTDAFAADSHVSIFSSKEYGLGLVNWTIAFPA